MERFLTANLSGPANVCFSTFQAYSVGQSKIADGKQQS